MLSLEFSYKLTVLLGFAELSFVDLLLFLVIKAPSSSRQLHPTINKQ
jgi:hypothetical protein